MGVPLQRAWEICRHLDAAEYERLDHDLERAFTLTAPTSGSGKTPYAGQPRPPRATVEVPPPRLSPAAEERIRQRRRRRLAAG